MKSNSGFRYRCVWLRLKERPFSQHKSPLRCVGALQKLFCFLLYFNQTSTCNFTWHLINDTFKFKASRLFSDIHLFKKQLIINRKYGCRMIHTSTSHATNTNTQIHGPQPTFLSRAYLRPLYLCAPLQTWAFTGVKTMHHIDKNLYSSSITCLNYLNFLEFISCQHM